MSSREVELSSTVAGITASGSPPTSSVWFMLSLRLMMGLAFFQSEYHKAFSEFSSRGYLTQAVPSNDSPLAEVFGSSASSTSMCRWARS